MRNYFADETEMEMRNCVVNIVAVILGSPKGSNHLWYHVMEPGHLDGTFLTGFMVGSFELACFMWMILNTCIVDWKHVATLNLCSMLLLKKASISHPRVNRD